MKGIGILPGYKPYLIDHIAPLLALLEVPLLVTDPLIRDLVELHYPPLSVILAEPEDYILDEALCDYDLFIYAHYYRMGHGHFCFDDYLLSKKGRSIITLHGNPDKLHDLYWIESLADEDIVLTYGPQLCHLLEEKRVKKKPLMCGNFRLEYYLEHASFFDKRLPFKKEKRTILYAPTWISPNKKLEFRKYNSSFFSVYRELFETLPETFQLVVKLHPLFSLLMQEELERIKEQYPHICFLEAYPPVYPLLKQVDIYLGDYSSVGYDFLYFNRPLFFLSPSQKTPLQECGVVIQGEPIYKTIEKSLFSPFEEKREELYSHAFGKKIPLNQLKESILHAL